MSEQFLNINELNVIKGLLHYLNHAGVGDLDAEVALGDSNGERVGTVRQQDGEYMFFYDIKEDRTCTCSTTATPR